MEGNVDKLAAKRMKKRGMSWTKQGAHRMACLLLMLQRGEVNSWPTKPVAPEPLMKYVPRPRGKVKDRKQGHYATWLNMGLPALSGPHSNRPWAVALRNLAHGGKSL